MFIHLSPTLWNMKLLMGTPKNQTVFDLLVSDATHTKICALINDMWDGICFGLELNSVQPFWGAFVPDEYDVRFDSQTEASLEELFTVLSGVGLPEYLQDESHWRAVVVKKCLSGKPVEEVMDMFLEDHQVAYTYRLVTK